MDGLPNGYRWVLERKLVGFGPFTSLQPWYFLKPDEMFDARARWGGKRSLIVFARRQDCDDLACFEVDGAMPGAVTVIHGWTDAGNGYDVVQQFVGFWDWMKSVIDDIQEWSERREAE